MTDICNELIDSLPNLRAFALALTRDRHWADDLVQDAVVKMLGASSHFQPGSNFRAWSFTVMRNLYYNERRRRMNERTALAETGWNAQAQTVPHSPVDRKDFARALARLSKEHREAVVLIAANGFSYQEAASICHCATGTLKSRLHRARQELTRMGLDPA